MQKLTKLGKSKKLVDECVEKPIADIARTVYFFYYDVYDGLFAYALSRKLVLLTCNHWDLGKIAGLLIEDWTV